MTACTLETDAGLVFFIGMVVILFGMVISNCAARSGELCGSRRRDPELSDELSAHQPNFRIAPAQFSRTVR